MSHDILRHAELPLTRGGLRPAARTVDRRLVTWRDDVHDADWLPAVRAEQRTQRDHRKSARGQVEDARGHLLLCPGPTQQAPPEGPSSAYHSRAGAHASLHDEQRCC